MAEYKQNLVLATVFSLLDIDSNTKKKAIDAVLADGCDILVDNFPGSISGIGFIFSSHSLGTNFWLDIQRHYYNFLVNNNRTFDEIMLNTMIERNPASASPGYIETPLDRLLYLIKSLNYPKAKVRLIRKDLLQLNRNGRLRQSEINLKSDRIRAIVNDMFTWDQSSRNSIISYSQLDDDMIRLWRNKPRLFTDPIPRGIEAKQKKEVVNDLDWL